MAYLLLFLVRASSTSAFTIHWYIQAVFFFLLLDVFTSMSVSGTLLYYSSVTFAWVIKLTGPRHVGGESSNLSAKRLRRVNLCSVT